MTQTRIQTVGRYLPRATYPAQGYYQPPSRFEVPSGVKGFFHDVWTGAGDQLKSDADKLLHPIDTINRGLDTTPRQFIRRTLAPYKRAFRTGHPGKAVGRLLADVAVIGGAILGGRALLSRGLPSFGGGASVGMRGPVGMAFDSVTGFVGGIFKGAGKLVGGVFHAIGGVGRWLIGSGGGGASIGLG